MRLKMNRGEIARLLKLCIVEEYLSSSKIFFEVSISKIPSIAPEGWAEKRHLDCVILESWRGSSKNPFLTHCIEIKSCKADFKSDVKWKNYIGRTDKLSFLALPNVIDPDDLPKGIGLIIPHFNPRYKSNSSYLEKIKPPKFQEVSMDARYDTMYGLAINTQRFLKGSYAKVEEEHKKLIEKHTTIRE